MADKAAAPKAALTYDDSQKLMNDFEFRGRIKVAALHFAAYVLSEATNTPAHNTRYKWAQNTYQQPDMVAQSLHPAVVMEDLVQQNGGAISDVDLQTATESVINKVI